MYVLVNLKYHQPLIKSRLTTITIQILYYCFSGRFVNCFVYQTTKGFETTATNKDFFRIHNLYVAKGKQLIFRHCYRHRIRRIITRHKISLHQISRVQICHVNVKNSISYILDLE